MVGYVAVAHGLAQQKIVAVVNVRAFLKGFEFYNEALFR